MTLPSIPTDSLYKFIFIAGIVMTLFSMSSTNELISEFDSLNDKLISLNEIQVKNNLLLKRDSIEMGNYIDLLVHQTNLEKKDSLAKSSSYKSAYVKLRIDSLVMFKKIFDFKLQRLENEYQAIQGRLQFYNISEYVCAFMVVVGMIFWFFQQLIQDKILKRQSNIIELEYQSKLKGLDRTKYRKT